MWKMLDSVIICLFIRHYRSGVLGIFETKENWLDIKYLAKSMLFKLLKQ